jgi:hypothetical protein
MHTNDSHYEVTFYFTKEDKDVRLHCKSTDPGMEAATAAIWGKGVAKKLGVKVE